MGNKLLLLLNPLQTQFFDMSHVLNTWLPQDVSIISSHVCYRAFVSTRPLVHKHVKMSVGKWILETTRPHKHVQIAEDDFLASLRLAWF